MPTLDLTLSQTLVFLLYIFTLLIGIHALITNRMLIGIFFIVSSGFCLLIAYMLPHWESLL